MADNNPRRPHAGQQYTHGWNPVTPAAAVQKNHGKAVKKNSAISRLLKEASESHQRMRQQDADRKAGKTPDMTPSKGAPTKSAAAKAGQSRGPESQKAEDAIRAALGRKVAGAKQEKPGETAAPKAPEVEKPAKVVKAKTPAKPKAEAEDPKAKALAYAKNLPKKDSPSTMDVLNEAQAAIDRGDHATAINALTKAMDSANPAQKKVLGDLRKELGAKAMGKDKAAKGEGGVPKPEAGSPKPDKAAGPERTSRDEQEGDFDKNPYADGKGSAAVNRREGGKRVSDDEMEASIRDVYKNAAPEYGDWITMTELRDGLEKKGLNREQTDAVLKKMLLAEGGDTHLLEAAIFGAVPPQGQADAVKIGGQWQHQFMLIPKAKPRSSETDSPAPKQGAPKPPPARSEPKPAESAPSAKAAKSAAPASHDGGPVSGAKTNKPTIRNTWGAGASEVSYHPDGDLSNALKSMGDDRKMEIDGDSLENVVGRLVTDTYAGRRSSQEVLDEAKKIRDRLPEGSKARNAMDFAFRDMDAPDTPTPKVPAGTPPALKQLVEDLHKVPEVRKDPGKDMDRLLKLMDEWAAGRMPPLRLVQNVRTQVANKRHESREASGDIRRATDKALRDLEAAARSGSLRPPGR